MLTQTPELHKIVSSLFVKHTICLSWDFNEIKEVFKKAISVSRSYLLGKALISDFKQDSNSKQ